jgi:hypothetical protein
VFNGIKVKEDIDNIGKLKGKHFYYFMSFIISLICELHVVLCLAPYIYYDTVQSQLAKKGVPKDAMIFMAPPVGQNVDKPYRFVSENWLETNANGKSIEETFASVEEICRSKGYAINVEKVDILSLSFEANQVLSFLIDLEKTPTTAAFDNFNFTVKL